LKPIVFPIAYCHPPGEKNFERESNAKKKKGQRDSRGSVTPGDPCVSEKKKGRVRERGLYDILYIHIQYIGAFRI
jgi:hypothetical protein